jgi:inorganic pyrophosphatase
MGMLFRAHPWHGVPIGDNSPDVITCYIEVVPTDTVKYELDKATGLLKIDRPQKFSNVCPALYGLLPRTYCGERIAARSIERTGRPEIHGDKDPLDVCVLAERAVSHGDILVRARPIGGLRVLDGSEADDKIIAVLVGDAAYGHVRDVQECPKPLIDRLRHYFETYKLAPGADDGPCEIAEVYGRDEAHEVIRRGQEDYREQFGSITAQLHAALDA